MLARWIRSWDSRFLKPLLLLLARCSITPNMLTVAGLAAVVASGFALARGHLATGATLLLAGGFLDGLDGELARCLKQDTRFGAFLDSLCDHCGDLAICLGLLQFSLTGHLQMNVIPVVLALFGSLFGSQVRSRASMLGFDLKHIGLFTRCERVIVLVAGLFANAVTPALWVLAAFNNLSALQRVIHVTRRVGSPRTHNGKTIRIAT